MTAPTEETLSKSRTAAAVARNRRLALGAGLFFLLGSALVGPLAVSQGELKFALVTLVGAAFGIWGIRGYLRQRNVLESPLFRMLRHSPRDITSITLRVQQAGMAEPQQTVHVACASGKQFVLYARDAQAVLSELSAWLPHAHVNA